MRPLAIGSSGMVTGVGLTAAATCAAIRAGITGFAETRFMSSTGDWLIGCNAPMDPPTLRGRPKLVRMAATAVQECLQSQADIRSSQIALLLCVAEPERPFRMDDLDAEFLTDVQKLLSLQFHSSSTVIARGRIGAAVGIEMARRLIFEQGLSGCVIAGVDSFLLGPTLSDYEARRRLLTTNNSNGFIPGEAAAAVLLKLPDESAQGELQCVALGFGREQASVESDLPLRADGLVEAYRNLHQDAGVSLDDAEYRFTDCNGEQYGFKEDSLSISRTVRKLKIRFEHYHPADSIGEVGAAIGPCTMALALAAAQKGYAPGEGVLCHFGNDEGDRAALLMRYIHRGAKP